MSRSEYRGFKC